METSWCGTFQKAGDDNNRWKSRFFQILVPSINASGATAAPAVRLRYFESAKDAMHATKRPRGEFLLTSDALLGVALLCSSTDMGGGSLCKAYASRCAEHRDAHQGPPKLIVTCGDKQWRLGILSMDAWGVIEDFLGALERASPRIIKLSTRAAGWMRTQGTLTWNRRYAVLLSNGTLLLCLDPKLDQLRRSLNLGEATDIRPFHPLAPAGSAAERRVVKALQSPRGESGGGTGLASFLSSSGHASSSETSSISAIHAYELVGIRLRHPRISEFRGYVMCVEALPGKTSATEHYGLFRQWLVQLQLASAEARLENARRVAGGAAGGAAAASTSAGAAHQPTLSATSSSSSILMTTPALFATESASSMSAGGGSPVGRTATSQNPAHPTTPSVGTVAAAAATPGGTTGTSNSDDVERQLTLIAETVWGRAHLGGNRAPRIAFLQRLSSSGSFPDELRGPLWIAASGASSIRFSAQQHPAPQSPPSNGAMLPNQPNLPSPAQRVMLAAAQHRRSEHERVGSSSLAILYPSRLEHVSEVLLSRMGEESAKWTLMALGFGDSPGSCLLPGFFSSRLAFRPRRDFEGGRDALVVPFAIHVEARVVTNACSPSLLAHLIKFDLLRTTRARVGEWLSRVGVTSAGSLAESELCLLDAVVCVGRDALVRTAVALLGSAQDRLLKCLTPAETDSILRVYFFPDEEDKSEQEEDARARLVSATARASAKFEETAGLGQMRRTQWSALVDNLRDATNSAKSWRNLANSAAVKCGIDAVDVCEHMSFDLARVSPQTTRNVAFFQRQIQRVHRMTVRAARHARRVEAHASRVVEDLQLAEQAATANVRYTDPAAATSAQEGGFMAVTSKSSLGADRTHESDVWTMDLASLLLGPDEGDALDALDSERARRFYVALLDLGWASLHLARKAWRALDTELATKASFLLHPLFSSANNESPATTATTTHFFEGFTHVAESGPVDLMSASLAAGGGADPDGAALLPAGSALGTADSTKLSAQHAPLDPSDSYRLNESSSIKRFAMVLGKGIQKRLERFATGAAGEPRPWPSPASVPRAINNNGGGSNANSSGSANNPVSSAAAAGSAKPANAAGSVLAEEDAGVQSELLSRCRGGFVGLLDPSPASPEAALLRRSAEVQLHLTLVLSFAKLASTAHALASEMRHISKQQTLLGCDDDNGTLPVLGVFGTATSLQLASVLSEAGGPKGEDRYHQLTDSLEAFVKTVGG